MLALKERGIDRPYFFSLRERVGVRVIACSSDDSHTTTLILSFSLREKGRSS